MAGVEAITKFAQSFGIEERMRLAKIMADLELIRTASALLASLSTQDNLGAMAKIGADINATWNRVAGEGPFLNALLQRLGTEGLEEVFAAVEERDPSLKAALTAFSETEGGFLPFAGKQLANFQQEINNEFEKRKKDENGFPILLPSTLPTVPVNDATSTLDAVACVTGVTMALGGAAMVLVGVVEKSPTTIAGGSSFMLGGGAMYQAFCHHS